MVFMLWQLNAASKAREVTVFCPFWIVNKTNSTLRIKDVSPYASTPSIALPMADDGVAKPALFRCCSHDFTMQRIVLSFHYFCADIVPLASLERGMSKK